MDALERREHEKTLQRDHQESLSQITKFYDLHRKACIQKIKREPQTHTHTHTHREEEEVEEEECVQS